MTDEGRNGESGGEGVRDLQREIQFVKAELRDSEARYASWKNVLAEECKDNETHYQTKLNASQEKFSALVADLTESLSVYRKEAVQTKEHNKALIDDLNEQVQDCVKVQSRKFDGLKEELTRSIKDQSRKFSKENASIAQAFLSRIDDERETMESAIQNCQAACDQKLDKFKVQTNVQFMSELRSQKAMLTSAFSDGLAEQKEALEGAFEGGLAVLKDTLTQLFRAEISKQRAETEETFLRGIDKMESWLKGENARRDAEMQELREAIIHQANEFQVTEERRAQSKVQLQEMIASETNRVEGLLNTEKQCVASLKEAIEDRIKETKDIAIVMKEETLFKTSKMVKECLLLNVQLKALEDRCAKHMEVYETALEECARTKEDVQLSLDNQNVVFQSYEDKILRHSADFQAYLDDHSATVEDLHAKFQDITEDFDRLQDKVLDQEGAIETTNNRLNRLQQDRAADNAQTAKMGKTWESLYAHLAAQLQDTIEHQESTWIQQEEAQNARDVTVNSAVEDLKTRLASLAADTFENHNLSLGLHAEIEKAASKFDNLRQSLGDLDQEKFRSLSQQVDDQAKMIVEVQDVRNRAKAEIDHLSAELQQNVQNLMSLMRHRATKEDLIIGIDAKAKEISTEIDSMRSSLADQILRTDCVEASRASQNTEIDEIKKNLRSLGAETVASLAKKVEYESENLRKLSDQLANEQQNFNEKFGLLDQKIGDVLADLNQRPLQSSVEEQLGKLDGALNTHIEKTNLLAEKNRNRAERLREDVDKCVIKVDVLQGNLGAININMFNELQKRVSDQTKQLMLDKQERSFAHSKIMEIEKTIDDRIQQFVRGEWTESQNEIRALVDNSDKKLSRNVAMLKNEVEDMIVNTSTTKETVDVCVKTLAMLSETSEQTAVVVADLKAQMTEESKTICENFELFRSGKDALTQKIEEKFDHAIKQLDEKIALLASCDFVSNAVETSAASIEKHVTAVKNQIHLCRGVVKSLEIGSSTISQNLEELRSSLSNIDKEFGALLSSQVESRRDIQTVTKLQIETRAEVGGIASAYEQQLRELKSSIAEFQAEIMAEAMKNLDAQHLAIQAEGEARKVDTAELRTQLNGQLDAISEHIKSCFQATETELRKVMDSQQVDVDERLVELYVSRNDLMEQALMLRDDVEQISTNVADIQATIEPAVASLSAKLEDQSSDLQATRDELSEVSMAVVQINSKVISLEEKQQEVSDRAFAFDSKLSEHKDEFKAKYECLEDSLKAYLDHGIEVATTSMAEKAFKSNAETESLKNEVHESLVRTNEAMEQMNESFTEAIDALNRKLIDNGTTVTRIESALESTVAKQSFVDAKLGEVDHKNATMLERYVQCEREIDAMKTEYIRKIDKRLDAVEQDGKLLKTHINTRVDGCSQVSRDMHLAFSAEVGNKLAKIDEQMQEYGGYKEASSSKIASIESTLMSIHTAIDTSLKSASSTVAEVKESLVSVYDDLSEVKTAVNQVSNRVCILEDKNREVSDRAVSIDSKLLEHKDEQKARYDGLEESLKIYLDHGIEIAATSVSEKTNKVVASLKNEFDQSLNRTEKTMQDLRESFTEVADSLDRKINENGTAIARIDATMDATFAKKSFVIEQLDEADKKNSSIIERHVHKKDQLDAIEEAGKSLRTYVDNKLNSVHETAGDLLLSFSNEVKTKFNTIDEQFTVYGLYKDQSSSKIASIESILSSFQVSSDTLLKSTKLAISEVRDTLVSVSEDLKMKTSDNDSAITDLTRMIESTQELVKELRSKNEQDITEVNKKHAQIEQDISFIKAETITCLSERMGAFEETTKSLKEYIDAQVRNCTERAGQSLLDLTKEVDLKLDEIAEHLAASGIDAVESGAKFLEVEATLVSLRQFVDDSLDSTKDSICGIKKTLEDTVLECNQLLNKNDVAITELVNRLELTFCKKEDVDARSSMIEQDIVSIFGKHAKIDSDLAAINREVVGQLVKKIDDIALQTELLENHVAVRIDGYSEQAEKDLKNLSKTVDVKLASIERQLQQQDKAESAEIVSLRSSLRSVQTSVNMSLKSTNEAVDEVKSSLAKAVSGLHLKLFNHDTVINSLKTILQENEQSLKEHVCDIMDSQSKEVAKAMFTLTKEVEIKLNTIKNQVEVHSTAAAESAAMALLMESTIDTVQRSVDTGTTLTGEAMSQVKGLIMEIQTELHRQLIEHESSIRALDESIKSTIVSHEEVQDRLKTINHTTAAIVDQQIKVERNVDALRQKALTIDEVEAKLNDVTAQELPKLGQRIADMSAAKISLLESAIESLTFNLGRTAQSSNEAVSTMNDQIQGKISEHESKFNQLYHFIETIKSSQQNLSHQFSHWRDVDTDQANTLLQVQKELETLATEYRAQQEGLVGMEAKLGEIGKSIQSSVSLGATQETYAVNEAVSEQIECLGKDVAAKISSMGERLENVVESTQASNAAIEDVSSLVALHSQQLALLKDKVMEELRGSEVKEQSRDCTPKTSSDNATSHETSSRIEHIEQKLYGVEDMLIKSFERTDKEIAEAKTIANNAIDLLDKNVIEMDSRLDQAIGSVNEKSKSFVTDKCKEIMERTVLCIEEQHAKAIEYASREIAEVKTIASNAVEHVTSTADGLDSRIDQQVRSFNEKIQNLVSDRCKEMKEQTVLSIADIYDKKIKRLETKSIVEAATLKKCVASDLEYVKATLSGQVADIHEQSSINNAKICNHIDELYCSIQTGTDRHDQLQADIEAHTASISLKIETIFAQVSEAMSRLGTDMDRLQVSNKSELEDIRSLLKSSTDDATELKNMVESLQVQPTIEEHLNSFAEKIGKETTLLASRIDGLDEFLKVESEKLTMLEQSVELRFVGLKEQVDTVDAQAAEAMESLNGRIRTIQSENIISLDSVRGIVETSLATLDSLSTQVGTMQKEMAEESQRLTVLVDHAGELSTRIETVDVEARTESSTMKQLLSELDSRTAALSDRIESTSKSAGELKQYLNEKLECMEESNQSELEKIRGLANSSIHDAVQLKQQIDAIYAELSEKLTMIEQGVEIRASDLKEQVDNVGTQTAEAMESFNGKICSLQLENIGALESFRCLVESNMATLNSIRSQIVGIQNEMAVESRRLTSIAEHTGAQTNALNARIEALDAAVRTESRNTNQQLKELESRAAAPSQTNESCNQNPEEAEQSNERIDSPENSSIESVLELKEPVDGQEVSEGSTNLLLMKVVSIGDETCVMAPDDRVQDIEGQSLSTSTGSQTERTGDSVAVGQIEVVSALSLGTEPQTTVEKEDDSSKSSMHKEADEPGKQQDPTLRSGLTLAVFPPTIESSSQSEPTINQPFSIGIGMDEIEITAQDDSFGMQGSSYADSDLSNDMIKENAKTKEMVLEESYMPACPTLQEETETRNVDVEERKRKEKSPEIGTIKKKVTIQTPTYNSQKTRAIDKSNSLRNALKALCEDLKSDVLPLIAEERDAADTVTTIDEERET